MLMNREPRSPQIDVSDGRPARSTPNRPGGGRWSRSYTKVRDAYTILHPMHGTLRTSPLAGPPHGQVSVLVALFFAVALSLPAVAALAVGANDNIGQQVQYTWGVAQQGTYTDFRTDFDDVLSVDLKKGQHADFRLTGSSGTDFDLYLFPPGTMNILDDVEVASSENLNTSSEHISYTAAKAGKYFIDVATWDTNGDYTLTGKVKPLMSLVATQKKTSYDSAHPATYDWAHPSAIKLSGAFDPPVGGLKVKVKLGATSDTTSTDSAGKVIYMIGTGADRAKGRSAVQKTADYTFSLAATTAYFASESPAVKIEVKPKLTVDAVIPSTITTTGSVTLSGVLKASTGFSGIRVRIENSSGQYLAQPTTNPNGKFSWTFGRHPAGTYKLRARYTGSDTRWHATGAANFHDVIVTP
jgi:hypothetical protein